jgi:hypothetical protein
MGKRPRLRPKLCILYICLEEKSKLPKKRLGYGKIEFKAIFDTALSGQTRD